MRGVQRIEAVTVLSNGVLALVARRDSPTRGSLAYWDLQRNAQQFSTDLDTIPCALGELSEDDGTLALIYR